MKVGIYGGSFNPIHFGHIGLAEWIAHNTDIDEIWLMVSPNNPLKDSTILADEHIRLQEARIATQHIKTIKVSDFEFNLPRPNYTANTLRKLSQAYTDYEFTLIIGEDNLNIFTKWRDYTYILANYRIFVYPRRGNKQSVNETIANMQIKTIKELRYLQDAPYYDISSTELRAKNK
jgi:nicotinate-nucleotide adenylyltransferase